MKRQTPSPIRNCDRFETETEAWRAYNAIPERNGLPGYSEWLFERADSLDGSRPVRNCDRFRGRDEALHAYVLRCCALTDAPGIKVQTDIFDFLFDPASPSALLDRDRPTDRQTDR